MTPTERAVEDAIVTAFKVHVQNPNWNAVDLAVYRAQYRIKPGMSADDLAKICAEEVYRVINTRFLFDFMQPGWAPRASA